jgi:hypothetical protein
MPPPDFSPTTVELLAYRSAYICNHDECQTLTIGPSSAVGTLSLKVGEAAHICGARPKTPRYETSMTNEQRAAIENGIWLCASCHTLVDKGNGVDFPAPMLREWKRKHEELITALLRTHSSPLPLIQRHSKNHALAQDAVDTISSRGAFFQDHAWEDYNFVITSVEQARRRLERVRRGIELDQRLRSIVGQLIDALREFMNETSIHRHHARPQLDVLRSRIGVHLRSLRDEYGCSVTGAITRVMPQ